MSHAAGLKHVATEPTRLESKRERRRVGSGRASALRRAPSDSDCSVETASLSADSGERARPPPPPPRTLKSRSRRRGSEWEVLEGLKDGQRFDKRPEVFNGYLHKKRKWPLKGWHKRFFVVDGGILVYARSPTDVARGRLHGSVDVGLSVISAKARRRRIDIDADEFIYHLRAKTPDVFRTWLTVLKTHRLYRQHLLTFGARESVPKIHAPLEELPPTDTSSRSTHSSFIHYFEDMNLKFPCDYPLPKSPSNISSSRCIFKSPNPDDTAKFEANKLCLNLDTCTEPIDLNVIKKKINDIRHGDLCKHKSLCSMHCVDKNMKEFYNNVNDNNSPIISLDTVDTERETHHISFNMESANGLQSSLLCKYSLNSPIFIKNGDYMSNDLKDTNKAKCKKEKTLPNGDKEENAATYFFFPCLRRNENCFQPLVRKSKKSTNLVKYQNKLDEPTLKKPLNNCMLLKKYIPKSQGPSKENKYTLSNVSKKHITVQADELKESDLIHNRRTAYDEIAEKLMVSIFENCGKSSNPKLYAGDVNIYVNEIINELNDAEQKTSDAGLIKSLFRCLLEYWLKNTMTDDFKSSIMKAKSVDRQSNKYFTRDNTTSNVCISNEAKATQFHGISDFLEERRSNKICFENKKYKKNVNKSCKAMDSFMKERRIQELEEMLKNTVYICETMRSDCFKEKDIIITRKLIDNLEKISRKKIANKSDDNAVINSDSSNELPQIQDTLNHLICETTIPPDVAKEFLGAYLDLLHENQLSESLPSTDESASNLCQPRCDVQTESIQKKVSISISTKEFSLDTNKQSKNNVLDSNQLYLKHLLSKITSIFSIENKTRRNLKQKVSDWNDINLKSVKPLEKDIIVKASINKDLLSIERINDENNLPSINKIEMLCKQRDLVKHSDNNLKDTTTETNKWFINSLPNFDSNELFKGNNDNNYHKMEQNSFINFNKCNSSNNIGIHLKPYESSNENYAIKLNEERYEPKFCFSESDVTSKGYRIKNESINSIDKNSYKFEDHSNVDNDAQSCFILSLKRGILTPKFKSKNNINNDSNLVTDVGTPSRSVPSNYSQEISIFENPPKVIDEQFILLLFENLTLLSKNVPSVYKDINNLYQKLRKRHGKVLPTNKSQGLSLLGKIYNQEVNVKSTLDNETQFEAFLNSCDNGLIKQQNATNTSRNLFTAEIATSTARLKTLEALETEHTELKNIDLAEESNAPKFENSIHNSSTQTTTFSSMSSEEEILKTDKAISNQNWYHQLTTRDCAMSTIIKCVLGNSGSSENFKFLGTRHEGVTNQAISIKTCNQYTSNQALYIAKKLKNDRRHAPKLRQNLIKEIALLSPSFKVSTQSQTEKKLRCLRDKSMNRDFKVYQLFLSQKYELKRSNSMIDSTEDFQIDDELKTIYRCSSDPYISGLASPASPLRGPQAGFVSGTPGGRLASWIIESGGNLDSAGRELGQAQLSVQQLQRLVDALELQQQAHHDTDVSLEGASPNVKKDRRKFGLRKKKSSNKCASVELSAPQEPGLAFVFPQALSALTAPPSPGGASSAPNSAASLPLACAATRPQSLPGAEALHTPASLSSLTPDHQLREDFTVLAKDLVASLKTIVATMVCERGRLRAAVEAADGAASPGGVLTALRTNLNSALRQNSELRTRLSRIHDASDLADVSSLGHQSDPSRPFPHSPSYSSSCVSASEFFDAEEPDELKAKILEEEAGVIELDGDSTSEAGSLSTEDGSASSDNSDAAIPQAEDRVSSTEGSLPADGRQSTWSRRTRLPRARPSPAPPSLWNLLYKNIGKDLSQISMPVTINEPLNMLQRLCEELEYSELLDAAARCTDAVERCALVAAFAVSAYAAAAHRAASKPFNPLLAETYECIRQDRGFKFVAEQVSHHPPISACHADAARWQFWQEARIKTKFWGKSMEFQPAGRVHVRLAGHHYSWNKVTTCVHNLFGGQRWVDQYGDMVVTCHGTDISCKLNFIKASSWSNSRHEVRGAVSAGAAGRLRLQGRWSEALLAGEPPAARCLWRPGAMPPEHELYYGFTRFAMELNEMEPALRDALPHTDTRHRPDQRALEEGDIEAAERFKLELEQAQRQRRRDQPDHTPAWFRKSVEDGEETWVFTGEYWKEREAGFPAPRAPRLW